MSLRNLARDVRDALHVDTSSAGGRSSLLAQIGTVLVTLPEPTTTMIGLAMLALAARRSGGAGRRRVEEVMSEAYGEILEELSSLIKALEGLRLG